MLIAKKLPNGWVISDEDEQIVAKAKLKKKNTGIYCKIIYDDRFEQDILYSPFACKNGRLKVNVFEDDQLKCCLHRSWKLNKNNKPCFYYNMRYNHYSYYGYNVLVSKKQSNLYLYHHDTVMAVCSIKDNYVEIYLSEKVDLRFVVAFLISHDILSQKKNPLINEYHTEPLAASDVNFISKIKEFYIKEDYQ